MAKISPLHTAWLTLVSIFQTHWTPSIILATCLCFNYLGNFPPIYGPGHWKRNVKGMSVTNSPRFALLNCVNFGVDGRMYCRAHSIHRKAFFFFLHMAQVTVLSLLEAPFSIGNTISHRTSKQIFMLHTDVTKYMEGEGGIYRRGASKRDNTVAVRTYSCHSTAVCFKRGMQSFLMIVRRYFHTYLW